MKIKLNYLLYLPIIFLFLPAFAMYVPFLNGAYLVFYMIIYALLAVLFILKPKQMISKIINVTKNTPLKYFTLFLVFVILNSFLLSCFGVTTFGTTIKTILIRLVLGVLPLLIYFIYILDKYISVKNFFKVFTTLFWLDLIIGFISYFGMLFNIEIINNIFDFFANARIIAFEKQGFFQQASGYFAFGLPRLDNLAEEPSFYAQFLFIFLPFVYGVALIKNQIYKNSFWDSVIKKTIVPFTWISLILTMSPIYLILCLILTVGLYFKQIIKFIIKHFIQCIIVLLCIISFILKVDFSDTYLSRIVNIITSVHSFDDFILIEQSLATRIVAYINALCIFVHHPVFGVGYGNISNLMGNQLMHSPVTLTPEITMKLTFANFAGGKYTYNANFIYDLLAENGIFITGILIYFYIKLFNTAKFLTLLNKKDSLLFDSFNCFYKCFIPFFILFFYNIIFTNLYLQFLTAILISQIYIYKKLIKQGDLYEQNT